MELSTLADWFGVVGGITVGATWIWKVQAWFRTKITFAQEGAAIGSDLVTELLNQATSPARRADIHAYIQFLCTEMESDYTRRVMHSHAIGYLILFIGLLLAVVSRVFVTDALPWLWWLSIATYIALVISFAMSLFFSAQLIPILFRNSINNPIPSSNAAHSFLV